MAREKFPVTLATRALRAAQIAYTPHQYTYVPRGGTAASAAALGADEHHVIKTLVMEDSSGAGVVVLMHGDRSVSTKALARHLGVKDVKPSAPDVAQRRSGYQVGGTSPFGLRQPMPVYVEASILDLPRLFINGGKRGFLVQLSPSVLTEVLGGVPVEVAI